MNKIPYRIDLAGGWLDQPFVSKHFPGAVLTISIEPNYEFNLRSGMASSTRKKAIELWEDALPENIDLEKAAKILFAFENPPGKKDIAGSQDALGILLPGLNYLYYNGEYWPEKIRKILDEDILTWIEENIHLVPLSPREGNFEVLKTQKISKEYAKKLSEAADNCLKAILQKNLDEFGKHMKESFEAQIEMFPDMINPYILNEIEKYKNLAKGWKLSGAGGGGYLILVSDKPIEKSIKIKIRR